MLWRCMNESPLELTYGLGDEKTNTLGAEFELSVDVLP